jgi:peptidyl-prolyl cis-trans isomerase C
MKVLCSLALLAIAIPAFAQANRPESAKPKAAPAQPEQTPHTAQPSADKPVLTIGNEKITAKEFEAFLETLPEQYRAQAKGPMKRQIAEQLASVKLLAKEARTRGLSEDPGVKSRIAFQTENLLAGAAFNDIMKQTKIEETALRKYYDEHKGEYEQVKASHVLVRFKGSPVPLRQGQKELAEEEALAKAQELRKKTVAGEDFAAIARAESDDAGSGANGGDLGTFKRGQMVPAFDQAAFSLPPGQISEPVKTQFGYHLIRVDAHNSKPFEEVKAEIENRMKPDMAKRTVESIVSAGNVVYDDTYFGPAQAPAAPVQPGTVAPRPVVK